jgi:hypothetical protein
MAMKKKLIKYSIYYSHKIYNKIIMSDLYPISYIKNMNVHDYLNTPIETKNCSVQLCNESGNKKYKNNLCSRKFCVRHCTHEHYSCCAVVDGVSCPELGKYGLENDPEKYLVRTSL